MELNVEKLVPGTGFFPEYLAYARQLTDAPPVFHVGAALGCYSSVVSNYAEILYPIKMPNGDQKMSWSPIHLWVLLTGPSGDRKTTAAEKAFEAVAPIIESQVVGSATTPESTFDLVAHNPDAFFYFPEGASFFSMMNAPYWQHGQGLFCELYDGRDEMKRQLAGHRTKQNPQPEPITIYIRRARVSMLVGVATAHLDNARNTDWTGGLIGRMFIIRSKLDKFNAAGKMIDPQGLERLVALIRDTRDGLIATNGIYRLGIKVEAAKMFAEWSTAINETSKSKPDKVRPVFRRVSEQVRRIAALYAISQKHTHIGVASMTPAIAIGNVSIDSIDQVALDLSDDPVLRVSARIMDLLDGHPDGLSYRYIVKAVRLSTHKLEPAIKSLINCGEVRVVRANNGDLGIIPVSRLVD